MELFSEPRVAEEAESWGLKAGGSMDLKTGWDFRRVEDRRKAEKVRAGAVFSALGDGAWASQTQEVEMAVEMGVEVHAVPSRPRSGGVRIKRPTMPSSSARTWMSLTLSLGVCRIERRTESASMWRWSCLIRRLSSSMTT